MCLLLNHALRAYVWVCVVRAFFLSIHCPPQIITVSGAFNEMTVEQLAATVSCFVWTEKSEGGGKVGRHCAS